MKNRSLIILVSLITSIGLFSCLDPVVYPAEPIIEFKEFLTYPDSARLNIDFTDGDGNVGLDQSDTTGNFCPTDCYYHYNLFLEYYEKQNGEWVHLPIDYTDPSQIPFYYRVPRVDPTGQNPALVGEISLEMPVYFSPSEFDTCKFEILLVDRSLNHSNTVETGMFIKP